MAPPEGESPAPPHTHADASWPDLVAKVKSSLAALPETVVDDGPEPTVAAAVWRLLTTPENCAELCDLYLGRHGQQVESLCRQIAARGPFAYVVEFGAGKGLLGRVLQELMPGVRLVNVEINDGVQGFDRADTQRIVLDVHDRQRVGQLLEELHLKGRVCVVAKHLCGAASDALLQSLLPPAADAVFVAPCCHSKIQSCEEYCNPGFLRAGNFSPAEWPMLIKLLAVSRLPIDSNGSAAADKSFRSWQRWEHTFGGRKAMIGFGRQVRMLIEGGRAEFLRSAGFCAQLVEYAPATLTSENILIVAERSPASPIASLSVPKVGVIIDAPSGALRTAQFLLELRGRLLERGEILPWLSVFACSDDSVAVLGTDVHRVISSLKLKASLLVGLRVVNRVYPFTSTVPSVEDIPLPPEGLQGPLRLAVSPRTLLQEVLDLATSAEVPLSPQHFESSISVRRLWDGSLGYACLKRADWHPGEEPQNWESCRPGSAGYTCQTKPSESDGNISIHRLLCRIEEWRLRLGVSLEGRKVVLHVSQEGEWSEALCAAGAAKVTGGEAEVAIVDCKNAFRDGLAAFMQSRADLALAIIPIAASKQGGRAARASQAVAEVAKAVTGLRLSAHHLISNREQERTLILRRLKECL